MGDILKFSDHKPYEGDEDDSVPCARCGKMILATSLRCPECGVHFQSEAQFFVHSSERSESGPHATPLWVVTVVMVLLAVFAFCALANR